MNINIKMNACHINEQRIIASLQIIYKYGVSSMKLDKNLLPCNKTVNATYPNIMRKHAVIHLSETNKSIVLAVS